MKTYLDTALLLKIYIPERTSPRAIELIEAQGFPLLFTHLHELELQNAVRLKRFRREITMAQEKAVLRAVASDRRAGRLERAVCDWPEVFQRAFTLSSLFSGKTGARSLDILHVAAAMELGCKQMITFDKKQQRIAVGAGLHVISS